MKTSKWCNENLNASSLTWKHIKLEVIELLDEISDVIYFTLCAIHTKTGISLPMIGAKSTINKIEDRLDHWKLIFESQNLEFDVKYLVNGSNYERDKKVIKALELARKDQMKLGR